MKKLVINGGSIGKLMLLVSFLIFVPVLLLPLYPEDMKYSFSFLVTGMLSSVLSLIACSITQKYKIHEEDIKTGSVIVLFIWLYSSFIGALPFVFGNQLTFVQALFESVSGWTTTGLSVMNVEEVPKIFLFYRSFMQYCGGLGFVMMIVTVMQGKQAMSLYSAEGHPDKLAPNLGRTARMIFTMYLVYLVIGTFLYIIFGMSFFDAINHAMCALSTGGFSTETNSIGAYNSLGIEVITIFLMLIGTTNFAVLLIISKMKFKQASKVSEIRFLGVILLITVPAIAATLTSALYVNFGEGLRIALFNVVSALSTSGFSTVSYTNWPIFSIGVMILLMMIGGGIGSTAGGIKLNRVYLMWRMMKENISRRLSSARTIRNPHYYRAQGKTYIDQATQSDTVGFIACYLFIFIIGSLLITLTESCALSDAMFEFASSLSTVGLSIGITGPHTNNLTLIIEIIGMLLGRLEIFIVLMGVYVSSKKIRQALCTGTQKIYKRNE